MIDISSMYRELGVLFLSIFFDQIHQPDESAFCDFKLNKLKFCIFEDYIHIFHIAISNLQVFVSCSFFRQRVTSIRFPSEMWRTGS